MLQTAAYQAKGGIPEEHSLNADHCGIIHI